jgi:hypothetical protein
MSETLSAEWFNQPPEVAWKLITETDLPDQAKAAAFMAVCISRNYHDYVAVVQPLYDGAQRDLAAVRHELSTVRRLVREAFAGPYAPSEEAVIAALYPTAAQLEQPGKP